MCLSLFSDICHWAWVLWKYEKFEILHLLHKFWNNISIIWFMKSKKDDTESLLIYLKLCWNYFLIHASYDQEICQTWDVIVIIRCQVIDKRRPWANSEVIFKLLSVWRYRRMKYFIKVGNVKFSKPLCSSSEILMRLRKP